MRVSVTRLVQKYGGSASTGNWRLRYAQVLVPERHYAGILRRWVEVNGAPVPKEAEGKTPQERLASCLVIGYPLLLEQDARRWLMHLPDPYWATTPVVRIEMEADCAMVVTTNKSIYEVRPTGGETFSIPIDVTSL